MHLKTFYVEHIFEGLGLYVGRNRFYIDKSLSISCSYSFFLRFVTLKKINQVIGVF